MNAERTYNLSHLFNHKKGFRILNAAIVNNNTCIFRTLSHTFIILFSKQHFHNKSEQIKLPHNNNESGECCLCEMQSNP